MSKKILIIFGHHNYKPGTSFNAACRDVFLEECNKLGHEVDLINIYEEKQIKFWDGRKPDEQILNYQERLEKCDVFMVMSPCHNYIMNAATENFLANVFIPPFSFTYRKVWGNFGFPVPGKLKGKTAIIFYSYGGPSFFVSLILQQIPRRVKSSVFKGLAGCKIKFVRFYEVLPNMPKKIFEKHMNKMRQVVNKL
tara:strand:- start:53 stop:637 length:585 start_codon:yes stop_codon:yes gene_type:complete